ncbi:MAG: hypothetical protein JJLCMIEE_01048 [Acidimicrobiales bacterium]|nr:hypothetical protein [Acidimicrobiales bacterium]
MNATQAVLKQSVRLFGRETDVVFVHVFLPLLIIGILDPVFEPILALDGYPGAPGSAQTAPAMAILFAFVTVGYVGVMFFREYEWNTYERMLASPATGLDIFLGKALPALLLLLAQQAVLFGVSWLMFDLVVPGSATGLVITSLALTLTAIAFGFMLVMVSPSIRHVDLFTNLGAMLFAGVGGALVPLSQLPGWVGAIAPYFPSYWASKGFRAVLLDGEGIGATVTPTCVMFAFAVLFFLVGAVATRVQERKL